MNMRTTFMLMAATVVAPPCAQQPTESAADVFRGLAAPQTAAAPSTADQRAAAFPMLKTIPADVDAFCAFTHLGEHLARIQRSGRLEELTGSPVEIPEAFLNLEGFSLALGKGSSASLEAVSPLLTFLSSASQTESVSWLWAKMAKSSLSEIIYSTSRDTLARQGREAEAQMPEVLVHPIYAVVSFRPTETMVKDWGNSLISMLQGFAGQGEEGEPGSAEGREVESVEINGMSGIRVKGSALVSQEPSGEPSDALRKNIAERTFYVLMKVDATSITTVICERPEEIRLAATPKESILASDLMAPTDAHPGLISVGYANPEFVRWNSSFSMDSYVDTAECFRSVFEKLGEAEPASQEAFRKAAAAITFALGSWEKMSQLTPGKPTFMQCWAEADAIEAESITPMVQGVSYGPTRLRLASMADAPDTIFYAEGGGVQRKEPLPSLMECLNGALDVVHGTLLTLPEEAQDEYSSSWQMAMSFLPECRGLASALQVIGSGLTGSGAVVVDAGGSLPASLGGIPGNKIAIPRLSFCADVSDRARLQEGWRQILSVAGNIATKLGQDPAVVGMLPIMPANAGNAVSYSVALPFFTEDMVPNATVSDTSLALGTSSKLNERVVNSATGNMDFVGAVFSFNPAPLASTLRGIADSLAASLPSGAECIGGRCAGGVGSPAVEESVESATDESAAVESATDAAATDSSDTCIELPAGDVDAADDDAADDDAADDDAAANDDADTDADDDGEIEVEVSTASEEKSGASGKAREETESAGDEAAAEGVVITEEDASSGDDDDGETSLSEEELTEREVAELEATERVENVEQAAQVAEFFARWVKSVHGVVTPAGEGSQAFRIRIRLR